METLELKTKILKQARKSLFSSYKKINGDLTISKDGTINRYEGNCGSTFAKNYGEFLLYEISNMSNDTLTVFEFWKCFKESLERENDLQLFLGLIEY